MTERAFNEFAIENPKLRPASRTVRDRLYPYYAGFAYRFARSTLAHLTASATATVLDPWNGSGTTTVAASDLGLNGVGYDLNPAMVVIAKARTLVAPSRSVLLDSCKEIINAGGTALLSSLDAEPLSIWFTPSGAAVLRGLHRAIQEIVLHLSYTPVRDPDRLNELSAIAAFFYVALFRTVRVLLQSHMASNPTWIRHSRPEAELLDPLRNDVDSIFRVQVEEMLPAVLPSEFATRSAEPPPDLRVASSEAMPLQDGVIDIVVSSPPYCTRIDYAVATTPELAVLGYDHDRDIQLLRRQLIGTTTVERDPPERQAAWGQTCLAFLREVEEHRSKASRTYYLKNHLQYFAAMFTSLGDIARVLKERGLCVLVVQDSYYKDIHNNLPVILAEMAASQSLSEIGAMHFKSLQTLAGVNRRIDPYRDGDKRGATETVLCLSRT